MTTRHLPHPASQQLTAIQIFLYAVSIAGILVAYIFSKSTSVHTSAWTSFASITAIIGTFLACCAYFINPDSRLMHRLFVTGMCIQFVLICFTYLAFDEDIHYFGGDFIRVGSPSALMAFLFAYGLHFRKLNPISNASRLKLGLDKLYNPKPGRLLAPKKLTNISSDASVGLHVKYERLPFVETTWDQSFFGMKDLQEKVRKATFDIHSPWYMRSSSDPIPNNAPNGILLLGDPGNGKTFIADCIAGSLGYPIFTLTAGDISSQWVGEPSKALQASFDFVKANSPCVVFLDEIDSIGSKRSHGSNAADAESRKLVNILITELVNLRKYPVIIVAATNLPDILDPAVTREGRFDYKIEVDNPDYEARLHLLNSSIKRVVPSAKVNELEIRSTAKRLNGFNVKRIMSIADRLPSVIESSPVVVVGHKELMSALRLIQGSKGRIPEDALPLTDLVLRDDLRLEIEDLLHDLKNIDKMEEYGGEVPRGVFLYGPPGTGKTTVAKTLSRESGWALISVSGPDLIADRGLLEESYKKAKNFRPAVIFIDEATEVVKNRTISLYPEITNKLLTLMDGFDEKVKDIIFIAASNHPEDVDPALIRSGRFSGKMQFTKPSSDDLRVLAVSWMIQRSSSAVLSDEVCFDNILKYRDLSPADVKGMLQTSLNNAIRENSFIDKRVCINQSHIDRSLRFLGL